MIRIILVKGTCQFDLYFLNGKFELSCFLKILAPSFCVHFVVINTVFPPIPRALCIELFCNEANIPLLKPMSPLKGLGFWLYYWFVKRSIKSATWGHGIGRHSVEDVWTIAQADIQALSQYLGKSL